MYTIASFLDFLEMLEDRKIFFKLSKIRDSILIEAAVPEQRWEIEFMRNGAVEIEKFISDGIVYGYKELDNLLSDFSD